MEEVVRVHIFEPRDHLIGQHANCFKSELAAAILEQIFERMSKKFHDHSFVVTFDSVPHYIGYALYTQTKIIHISYYQKRKVTYIRHEAAYKACFRTRAEEIVS